MTSKTDKELAVELMIASLNHYSSIKTSNGSNAVKPLSVDSIINGVTNYYAVISNLGSSESKE